MPYGIESVTVIGGTMGPLPDTWLTPVSARGCSTLSPTELTAEESAAGLTLADRKVRNRIVQTGYDRMVKAKPSNLFTQSRRQSQWATSRMTSTPRSVAATG